MFGFDLSGINCLGDELVIIADVMASEKTRRKPGFFNFYRLVECYLAREPQIH